MITLEDFIETMEKNEPGFKQRVDAALPEYPVYEAISDLRRRGLSAGKISKRVGVCRKKIALIEEGHFLTEKSLRKVEKALF